MPLAKALRERGHKNRIGFFLHTPCPPPEILTALPHHERLIPSLCEYDLSRFAGAAHECKTALLVNPFDPDSVAAAIGQALSMPLGERRERHDTLFRVLLRNDIRHWADRFLTALERKPRALSHLEQMPSEGS